MRYFTARKTAQSPRDAPDDQKLPAEDSADTGKFSHAHLFSQSVDTSDASSELTNSHISPVEVSKKL